VGQPQVDREPQLLAALEVRVQRLTRGGQLAVGADHVRAQRGGDLGQRDVLALALEGHAHDPVGPAHHEQAADRRGQAGVEGIGEAFADGSGRDGLQQRFGQGGHA
jgi:hypothetical protein